MKFTKQQLKQIIKEELEAVQEGGEVYRQGSQARQSLDTQDTMDKVPIQDHAEYQLVAQNMMQATEHMQQLEKAFEMGDNEVSREMLGAAMIAVRKAQKAFTEFIEGYISADQNPDSWAPDY